MNESFTSTVIAVFCVFLPIRSTCSYVDFMYFLATLNTQYGQVAEKSNVWGLSSESLREKKKKVRIQNSLHSLPIFPGSIQHSTRNTSDTKPGTENIKIKDIKVPSGQRNIALII